MCNLDGDGRGVDQLIGSHSGQRTAGHVAHHIAARAFWRQADGVESIHYLRQRFDAEPVKLNVLAHGNVGQVAGILARNSTDGAKLAGRHNSVGNANAHHEPIGGQAFSTLAADGAYSIALRVDSPPFEVSRRPFRHDAGAASAGKLAYLVEGLPGVLLALEAFHALGFGFFYFSSLGHFFLCLWRILLQEQKTRDSLAVSRAIGETWIYDRTFRPRLPVRAKVRTEATTGHTIHEIMLAGRWEKRKF